MNMVHEELVQSGADIFYLDHRDIFNCEIEHTYSKEKGERCLLHNRGRILDMKDVGAAYIRPYNFREYEEMQGRNIDDPVAIKAGGFEMYLTAWLDASDAYVVNRSAPSATNNSKPLQLSLLRQAGFKIPETLITNSAPEAKHFLKANSDVIFKSISGVRSIVEKVSAAHELQLDDVQWCPTLFQKVVPGNNYRVHVVNDEVFAVRIESDRLDYRYGNTTMEAEELPAEIAGKCCKITSSLGLHLSGIDLMRTPAGEWYCFEVNPSPAYSYFEMNSGVPVSKAIAKALIQANKAGAPL